MKDTLIKWAIFSVILALVPLGASWLIQLTHKQGPTIESILAHGELLLITVALCTAAVGELIGSSKIMLPGKYIAGGASLLIAVSCAIYFADIAATHAIIREAAHVAAQLSAPANTAAASAPQAALDLNIVMIASIIAYGGALITSGCCIALSED